jgi:hypothetical protein
MKRFPSNPDDPAFPCDVNKTHKGLTKREFAAIIMCNGVFGIADVDKLFDKLNGAIDHADEELKPGDFKEILLKQQLNANRGGK